MKLKFIVLIIFACSLTSCFDFFETFTINEDKSGVYEQKMDFSRAMQGMIAMMSEKGMEKRSKKVMEKKDSTFFLKSIVDTLSTLSAAEKAVFSKASTTVHLDEEKGEMIINLSYPFANPAEFDIIQNALSNSSNGTSLLDAVMDAASNGKSKKKGLGGLGEEAGEQKKEATPIMSQYLYKLTESTISRKVKGNAGETVKSAEMDGMPDEMKTLMITNITTIIKLPRPAKDFKGKEGVLSADKKQLKFTKQISLDDKLGGTDFDFDVNY